MRNQGSPRILTVAKGVNKLQKELFDEPPPKKKHKKR
jgi:hypothetical protein